MPKRYPDTFDPHNKPYFYKERPKKLIDKNSEIHRIELESGCVINDKLREELIYKFDLDYDYECCYYPSDERTARCSLIGYTEEVIENPNYKSELRIYNRERKKYIENLNQWTEWKELWEEDLEKRKTIREKRQLKILKKKYEG